MLFSTKEHSESGQNTDVEMKLKCKSARNTNVTSEWKGILELHKILRQQSNDTQSLKSARYQRLKMTLHGVCLMQVLVSSRVSNWISTMNCAHED